VLKGRRRLDLLTEIELDDILVIKAFIYSFQPLVTYMNLYIFATEYAKSRL